MSISTVSVLSDLLNAIPQLRPQLYFKASLTALSHAMEDRVLADNTDHPLLIASFQRERYYRQEAHRYKRIAQKTDQVYVLSALETDFTNASGFYETIAFDLEDPLSQEWHLVIIGQQYATCVVCRERFMNPSKTKSSLPSTFDVDSSRQFEGIWTSDRTVSFKAAELLLARILNYRPELSSKIEQARDNFGLSPYNKRKSSKITKPKPAPVGVSTIDLDPFVERLVTYLQAGQYKLLKAYGSIAEQERKERLVNSITSAIRRGSNTGQPLHPQEILSIAVEELGLALLVCRCLIYRAGATETTATITHEFLKPEVKSIAGQTLQLQQHPLFQLIIQQKESIAIDDTQADDRTTNSVALQELVERFALRSWLIVPVLYQSRLLGVIELHHCGESPHPWQENEISLVEELATQIGAALIQAEAYANLEDLNQQLEALDRTRSNLIAITGHELRTPLSTIQVCLESLATEPDMPWELREVMLSTALSDSERMRKLVQDFLTLSSLESGQVQWHAESLSLEECVELALSRTRSRVAMAQPKITTQVLENLPLVRADGDWLVEVISKLLDNASKFTPPQGEITISAVCRDRQTIEVTVTDTGRGIENGRLELVFDRFYQEEASLRRTVGGTGLGLAICRQIVTGWGGKIWAESEGKDRGSKFHFTIPIAITKQVEPRSKKVTKK
ncbi:MAG: GAF domain-containing protein [Chroococcus sp. CMT-3BRIN-NPC107]|jgi:DICT domain-containing protein/signal transduction histidine kinase|nr:GAF domain-containing protein [Chroococcus sp. CMT-3BRIN-NPC107]